MEDIPIDCALITVFFKGDLSVLAIKELNRRLDFQAGFADKFGGCRRLSGSVCQPNADTTQPLKLVFDHNNTT